MKITNNPSQYQNGKCSPTEYIPKIKKDNSVPESLQVKEIITPSMMDNAYLKSLISKLQSVSDDNFMLHTDVRELKEKFNHFYLDCGSSLIEEKED